MFFFLCAIGWSSWTSDMLSSSVRVCVCLCGALGNPGKPCCVLGLQVLTSRWQRCNISGLIIYPVVLGAGVTSAKYLERRGRNNDTVVLYFFWATSAEDSKNLNSWCAKNSKSWTATSYNTAYRCFIKRVADSRSCPNFPPPCISSKQLKLTKKVLPLPPGGV